MKKYIVKIISFIMVLTLITTTFSACSSLNLNNVEAALTKGQWIGYLGDFFGLDGSDTDEQYFKDVSVNDELFPYVEACVNWNIIPKSEKFNDSEKVTREYVFATLVRAIGDKVTGLGEYPSDKEAAEYAVKSGLASSKSWLYMHEGVTAEEAEEFAESAAAIALTREYAEYDNTEYNSNLKQHEDVSDCIVDQVDNIVTINGENPGYKVGDIVAFGEGVDTVYVKVKNVKENDGKTVLETETPDLEDVFEKIDISGTSYVTDASQIQCEPGAELIEFDGMEVVGVNEKPVVKDLGSVSDDANLCFSDIKKNKSNTSKNFTFKLSFGSKGPSVEIVPNVNKFTSFLGTSVGFNGVKPNADEISKWCSEKTLPERTQKKTGWASVEDKYKAGWSLTGTLTVNDFTVSTEIDTKEILNKTIGLNSMDITTSSKTSFNVALKGYLSQELKVATVVIPVVGPLGVKIAIKVHAEINGQLSYTYEVENKTNVSYSTKKGAKQTSSTTDSNKVEFQVEISVGVEFSLAVSLGSFSVVEFALDISVKVTAKIGWTWLNYSKEGLYLKGGDEAYLEDRNDAFLVCLEVKAVLPVVGLTVKLFPDVKWLKLKIVDKKLVDEKKAPIKAGVIKLHWEFEGNKFVYKGDECLKDSLVEYKYEGLDEAKEDENYDEETTIGDEHHFLTTLDTYLVEMNVGDYAEVNVVGMPHGYSIGDIKCSVEDSNIAQLKSVEPTGVQSGAIKLYGNTPGITTLNVTLKGKDSKVTVIVNE